MRTPPTKFRDCQSASPRMLAARIHCDIPEKKEIKRNVHELLKQEEGRGGGEVERERGGGRENEEAGVKGTEIRMGMNFIATLEARGQFSRKITSTLRFLPSQIIGQVGG